MNNELQSINRLKIEDVPLELKQNVFENKDQLKKEANISLVGSIIVGFVVGGILGLIVGSTPLFWGIVVIVPSTIAFLNYMNSKKIEDIFEYRENELKTSSSKLRSTMDLYFKKYSDSLNFSDKIPDLTNLIKQKGFSVTLFEVKYLLKEYILDKITIILNNNFSKNDKSIESIIQKYYKLINEDFEYQTLIEIYDNLCLEESYYTQESNSNKIFLDYLKSKDYNLDLDDIKLTEMLKTIQNKLNAKHFELKLNTDSKDLKENVYIKNVEDILFNLTDYDFENYISKIYASLGFTTKITPKSHDQGADILISRGGLSKVIQAKKYTSPVSNKAIQEVVAAKKMYDAEGAIVVTTNTFTKSAIQLAKVNNVELVDYYKLSKMITEYNGRSKE